MRSLFIGFLVIWLSACAPAVNQTPQATIVPTTVSVPTEEPTATSTLVAVTSAPVPSALPGPTATFNKSFEFPGAVNSMPLPSNNEFAYWDGENWHTLKLSWSGISYTLTERDFDIHTTSGMSNQWTILYRTLSVVWIQKDGENVTVFTRGWRAVSPEPLK
jgi:hypothetical protein